MADEGGINECLMNILFENAAEYQLHRKNAKCWQAGTSQIFVKKLKLLYT